MMKREWFAPGIHLGYVYEDSPVIVPGHVAWRADAEPTQQESLAIIDVVRSAGGEARQ